MKLDRYAVIFRLSSLSALSAPSALSALSALMSPRPSSALSLQHAAFEALAEQLGREGAGRLEICHRNDNEDLEVSSTNSGADNERRSLQGLKIQIPVRFIE